MMQRARMTSGGAVCIAGTVGAGKSTTLATRIRKIPSHRKLISLENPVEYVMHTTLQNTLTTVGDTDPSEFKLKAKQKEERVGGEEGGTCRCRWWTENKK